MIKKKKARKISKEIEEDVKKVKKIIKKEVDNLLGKQQKKVKEEGVNFHSIEKKWQNEWEAKKIFEVSENSNKKKYYVLEFFPYPSGSGLHMGHAFNYTIGDVYARLKRMQGFNVLYPMGYDSLGLPAENAAIKQGVNPKDYTENAISNFIKQQKKLGLSYDWNRMIKTHSPDYYKWDQWIFLKMLEKGLAYKKKSAVNYCRKCDTVLANEQVHNGKCWRHEDTDVEIKHLEQWFFRITKYADELYDVSKLEKWPARIKLMQENWIGKSHGIEINFSINGKNWKIFTTRPDTIYGVTFMVVSSQHPKLMELVTSKQKKPVEEFLRRLKSVSEKELKEMEKEGVFTGSYAENPVTKEKVPVYAGNFVVADYGSGMVMAVPSHDTRDWEFAKKYKIEMKEVIEGGDIKREAYTNEGKLINSKQFSGVNSRESIGKISDYIEKNKLGKRTVNYKLRDWLISRQRYWGTPIPVIYCKDCGMQAIPEKELPVELPEKVKFGKGNPLETAENWIKAKCPKCGKIGRRETDTMDTFVNSSWYYLRYCDPRNNKEIFDKKKASYWTPIDIYIGGAEHACMHLIYFRFYTKFLRDLGLLEYDEPAPRLFNQGMLHGEDGAVMSKSRGNVVLPEEVSKKYGIDTARLFLMSIAFPDTDITWSENGIEGSLRFINKVINYYKNIKPGKSDEKTESKYNKLVKEATDDIENLRYNLAIIKLRSFFDNMNEKESKEILEGWLKIFSVFCPHIAEELWHNLGNKTFISLEKWPEAGEINLELLKQDEQVEKLINDIRNILKILESRGENKKSRILVFAIPKELSIYQEARKTIEKAVSMKVEVLSIQEAGKTGKKIKAVPGKPGIFIE